MNVLHLLNVLQLPLKCISFLTPPSNLPLVEGRTMPGTEVLRPEATHLSHSDACLGDGGTRELCARLVLHANLTSLDLVSLDQPRPN